MYFTVMLYTINPERDPLYLHCDLLSPEKNHKECIYNTSVRSELQGFFSNLPYWWNFASTPVRTKEIKLWGFFFFPCSREEM